jgi:8-oxo-dGTP pyrophosphatase MutT (NUDIX family)
VTERLADEPERWPVVASRDVYRGGAPFALREDTITAPGDDEEFARLVVEHPGAVVILAVDDDERALVLRQYRHPAGIRFVELPAGLLDVPGEDPVEAAKRELLEEAALEADEWVPLATTWSSPGICAEHVRTYLARGLHDRPDRGGFEPAHEEAHMTSHWVPVDDLLEAVLDGRVSDAPVVIALQAYALRTARGVAAERLITPRPA